MSRNDWLLCTMAVASLVSGCSSDNAEQRGTETSDTAIAALVRVCSPDDCLHYLHFLKDLPVDGKLDRSTGIESGNTQGAVYGGAAYIFDRDALTITRWTADAQLNPVRGDTVSLQGTGLKYVGVVTNAFVSATRAFLQDSDSGLIVTWNPTSMEIVASTPLPDAVVERDGIRQHGFWPSVSGGRVYYPMSAYDYDSRTGYDKVVVASLDASEDVPQVTLAEDDRCAYAGSIAPFVDGQGNVYVVGDWNHGLSQIGSKINASSPACVLRIQAGESHFDPDYYVDLLAAADARAIYTGYSLGEGKLLAAVWPTSSPAPSADAIATDPDTYFSFKGFEYRVIDLEEQSAVNVTGIPPAGAGNTTPLTFDGRRFVQVYPQAQTTGAPNPGSQLFEVSADGTAREVLSAGTDGDFEMIGRLR